jgi:predicted Zn-dependent peptidase
MEFKQTQLSNGLTIVAEVNPTAASLASGFFVRTGSRDETPEIAGGSHFLEHMIFKGTERRSAADVNREFDEMGASYNASTSQEITVYYAAVLAEFQDNMLDLLGDILRPSLRQADFDVEKNVILEEIAMYQDRPHYRLYDQLMAKHFAGHPLGKSILGTIESIRDLKRDDMQAYFDRRYSPSNVTLVGVGNIDFPRYVAKAQQMCSAWKRYDVDRPISRCTPLASVGNITDKKVARQNIGLMSKAPTGQDNNRFAAMLAATVIGDSTGSRLFYSLVEPAIADEASMGYDALDGEGAFITFISTDPDQAETALAIVREELKKFQDTGPSPDEMTAAKNKSATLMTRNGELPMGRLGAVAEDWVYRKEYVPLSKQIDDLFAVSIDDVMQVVRTSDLTTSTVLGLGPLDKI